jgi:hypothetical protein
MRSLEEILHDFEFCHLGVGDCEECPHYKKKDDSSDCADTLNAEIYQCLKNCSSYESSMSVGYENGMDVAWELAKTVKNMDGKEKECMLYLPNYSEVYSVKIGIQEGAQIESMESPFRHRIGIFGSSYTHGVSTSRPGMSYPMQLMRWTGLQFLSLGCSGNCKMQPYLGEVLCDANVDALIFDSFSNPDAQMIEERLFPFIEQIQKAHPDIPLIFQQTIYRERRNFDLATEEKENAKQEMAAKLMKEACKKYKNVYFIQTNATDELHETSVDGTHPGDYGYTLWAKSIEKPILKILKKYGIR